LSCIFLAIFAFFQVRLNRMRSEIVSVESMTTAENDSFIQCEQCHSRLPPDATFCGYCGQLLAAGSDLLSEKACASCGQQVRPDSVFCGYCGRAFNTEAHGEVATNYDRPSGVLFCRSIIIGLAAVVLVGLIIARMVYTRHQENKLSNTTWEQSATAPASTPLSSKLLTKDPDYMRLLHPVQGDALLDSSTEYAHKKQEIESKLASIQDPELRTRLSDDEWSKVDKSVYIKNEEESLRASFPSAILAVLQKHRADWFEIGHVEYPGTNVLQISSVAASPIELPDGATIPMDTAAMDGVYSMFRDVAEQQIQQNVEAWMYAQSCTSKLRNVCVNLGGTPSQCSDPSALSEIQDRLGGGLSLECNDNPSSEAGRNKVEKQMRESRLVLVGQGDLIAHRIDKLLLVDYDTETILHDFGGNPLKDFGIRWRFSGNDKDANAYVDYDFVVGQSISDVAVSLDSPEVDYESVSRLEMVDFNNREYDFRGRKVDISGGVYKQTPSTTSFGSDDIRVNNVWRIGARNGQPEVAVVSISETSCGGSCSSEGYVFVFAVKNDQLSIVQRLEFDAHAGGVGAWFDSVSGHLTIRARSRDGSANCCPMNLDVADYLWSGSEFTLNKAVRVPVGAVQPKPSPATMPPVTSAAPTTAPTYASLYKGATDSGTTVQKDSKAARKLNSDGLRVLAVPQPNLVEAKSLFQQAVQLDPKNVEMLNNLGDVVGRLEDYKTAEEILAKVLTMAPKRRVANGDMGYVEAKLGNIDRAEVYFCEYIRAFDSFDKGEAKLKGSFGDPDPRVQNAVSITIANCRP
jgi:hypothetical protein